MPGAARTSLGPVLFLFWYMPPLINGKPFALYEHILNRFGDSGAPWELIKEFEVSAEHIAQKAVELIAIARMKKEEDRFQLAH